MGVPGERKGRVGAGANRLQHPVVTTARVLAWVACLLTNAVGCGMPGLFDCFCCPHASVHRPSIACLAVFLCA